MKRAGYFGGLAGAHRHPAARPLRPPRRTRQADVAAIAPAMPATPRPPSGERAVTRPSPDLAVIPTARDRATTQPRHDRVVMPAAASAAATPASTADTPRRAERHAPTTPVRQPLRASAADRPLQSLQLAPDLEPPVQPTPAAEAIAPGRPQTRVEEPIARALVAPSARAILAAPSSAQPRPRTEAPASPGASARDSHRRILDDPPAVPSAVPPSSTRAAAPVAVAGPLPPRAAHAAGVERQAPATLTPRPAASRQPEPTPSPARRPAPPDPPARVHIGTIDVTIVPPAAREPWPVRPPSAPAAVPAAPGSLSRGPGSWYGLGQR